MNYTNNKFAGKVPVGAPAPLPPPPRKKRP